MHSDGMSYLRLAKEILKGNAFYENPGSWASIWPVGYSTIIAVISFITWMEVYPAAVFISVVTVWLMGIILYKRFGQTAWVYALVMLNTGFLMIFYWISSEIPFILGMIIFAFTTADIIVSDTVKKSHYIKLSLATMLMFLTRYVGVFAFAVFALLWIYNVCIVCKQRKSNDHPNLRHTALKRVKYLTISAGVTALSVAAYLLVNYIAGGHIVGYGRSASLSDLSRGHFVMMISNLGNNQLREMNNIFGTFVSIEQSKLALPLWFAFIAFSLGAIIMNKELIRKRNQEIIVPVVFLAIGVIYWISMVAMRFLSINTDIYFRFLLPSTAMLFIGFIGLLMQNRKIREYTAKMSGVKPDSSLVALKDKTTILNIITAICLSLFLLIQLIFVPILYDSLGFGGYKSIKKAVQTTNELPKDIPGLGGASHEVYEEFFRYLWNESE
jgi:preprotein translocase subunit SecG